MAVPWLSYATIALMMAVIAAMALLPSTQSQFLMSGLTLAVILMGYEIRRRYGRRPESEATDLPAEAVADAAPVEPAQVVQPAKPAAPAQDGTPEQPAAPVGNGNPDAAAQDAVMIRR